MNKSRALLIRFNALGDLIQSTVLLDPLRTMVDEVHLLTEPIYGPLMERDPRLDHVWTLARNAPVREIQRVLRELRSPEPWALVLDLQGKPRTRWLARNIPARRHLRVRRWSIMRRLALWRKDMQHDWMLDRALLGMLDRVDAPVLPSLRGTYPFPEGAPEGGVVVGVGAARPLRVWPGRHLRALVDILSRSVKVALVGDARDAQRFRGVVWPRGVWNGLGRTSLVELAGLLQRARLYVGMDSGPAHLAAAVGTPAVVLYGPTHPALGMRPRGVAPVWTLGLPLACRPCSLHGEGGCPLGTHRCMEDLSPARVARFVLRWIHENQ